jgi:Zn-dependent metalloprotease
MHMPRGLRKEDGGLSSGIASANNDNFLIDADGGLHRSSGVMNPLSLKEFVLR